MTSQRPPERQASTEPVAWRPQSIEAGGWKITALADGFFRLDGGAMWGVVPKNLWAKLMPAADDNTILMSLRPFLLEKDDIKCVLEPGIGDRWEDKWRKIYHILPTTSLVESLERCGVGAEEITHVIASHCHWDHIGAQVDRDLRPVFPNAQHFAPRQEVALAKKPGQARRGSYRAEDVTVIEDAGLLETYEGSRVLIPGIRAHVLGGHSDGVSVITVGEDAPGETAIFWADVVPTSYHIQQPYIMAYDIDVARSFEVRGEWLRRAADENWIGLYYHDPDIAFGRLSFDGKRFAHVEVEEVISAE